MSWQQWVYLTVTLLGAAGFIAKAGKPRDDYPAGGALVVMLAFMAGWAWFVLWAMS